jgi:sugar fermentation stimulation protein A
VRLPPLIPGRLVRRDNRFRVTVELDGKSVGAHLPNSGRLTELLTPRRPCWLEPISSPHRKTDFDFKLVEYAGVLISVDARLPNQLLAEALAEERLVPFQGCTGFEREVPLGESRVDFRLQMPSGIMWIETKSVTLVEDSLALFPDAPTARGTRHVRELTEAVHDGDGAAIVFIVQRPDARRFAPYDAADPAFGEALRAAAERGVDLHAWTCQVSRETIIIAGQIPVDLARGG